MTKPKMAADSLHKTALFNYLLKLKIVTINIAQESWSGVLCIV